MFRHHHDAIIKTNLQIMCGVKYIGLLYGRECFTEKYTTRKIHMKLHPGTKWRIFHIFTSEDIDDVISRSFTAICPNSQ